MSTAPDVAILGAALDLGQGRRGVDMGPSAIRYADLVGRLAELGLGVHDLGTVVGGSDRGARRGRRRAPSTSTQILAVCDEIAGHVESSSRAGELPLVLGGDHSLALGVFGGLARVHGPVGAIWFDAHADCNTPETTPSGNVHGMGLSGALGWDGERFAGGHWPVPSVDEDRTVLIGVRSLDPGERERLRAVAGARVHDLRGRPARHGGRHPRRARARARRGARARLARHGRAWTRSGRPASARAVRGGISYREAHLAMELVSEAGAVGSLEVVEVNPILDRENMTGELAVELICSALGQHII